MAIVNNIISEMEKQHISAAQVCRLAHISQGNFSDWRNGRSEPKAEAISKIASVLNVSTDYLIGNEVKEKSQPDSDEVPEEFILMARKMSDIDDEQRKRIFKLFDSTIDTVLEAVKHDKGTDK